MAEHLEFPKIIELLNDPDYQAYYYIVGDVEIQSLCILPWNFASNGIPDAVIKDFFGDDENINTTKWFIDRGFTISYSRIKPEEYFEYEACVINNLLVRRRFLIGRNSFSDVGHKICKLTSQDVKHILLNIEITPQFRIHFIR